MLGFPGKTPTQLDRINAKQVQHVFIDYRQLLYQIINPHRTFGQTQMPPQSMIRDGADPG
jgi:hypothetical protein